MLGWVEVLIVSVVIPGCICICSMYWAVMGMMDSHVPVLVRVGTSGKPEARSPRPILLTTVQRPDAPQMRKGALRMSA